MHVESFPVRMRDLNDAIATEYNFQNGTQSGNIASACAIFAECKTCSHPCLNRICKILVHLKLSVFNLKRPSMKSVCNRKFSNKQKKNTKNRKLRDIKVLCAINSQSIECINRKFCSMNKLSKT